MINVGIIGLGTVAQLMHLPLLSSLYDKYRIAAVCDVSPSLTDYIAGLYSAKAYASPEELVKDPDVDAVFVLSPDQYHADYGIMAMNAGKHVFIEKPVALCPQDLERLIEAEKANPGVICMVGYMRRYANGFLKCKELLEGDDRPIEYVRLRDIILEGDFFIDQTKHPFMAHDIPADKLAESRARRYEQVGKALGENCTDQQRISYVMLTGLGCHTLAAARELFGNPKEIKSVAVDGEHVIAVFQYDGFLGVYEIVNDQDIVQFDAAIEIYQHSRRMRVKYETPYLRYQPHSFEVLESSKTDTKTTVYGPDYHDAFENELHVFAECIAAGKKPKSTLEDSMEDLKFFKEIIDKIA